MKKASQLSRRERQIIDVILERGECSARDVHGALADAPSYSSVRTLLGILVEKGHLRYRSDGPRYLYSLAQSREKVRETALQRLLKLFFSGSRSAAVAALLGKDGERLSDEELDELHDIIEKARRKRG
ncbi:BlaI/MecI/CopY family transcriptional regulator [Mangrovimicrobium sediminis]|uniref:BlaI/MecI/CopY family transcriptional regulator n=1 Tax=Mangrovimicrobium sediminis TaxID=2562682 RepID=A0A4Z0LXL5_9GAMM|nr:BlaI/MecI/CopY family transcriptional regulator [Haliea sp. SAOS-164]TGD72123.1 BlaI/MecI/CopY family transcriptional regulator [Haliea sp. SAOS-164]